MRTTLFLVVAVLAGCKWTDFDDLADSTWVKSSEKPNNDATDWGVALARGLRNGSGGGTLVVLGTGQALYTELTFDGKGNSSLASNEVKLNNDFAIASLTDQPLLLTDPESDDISLVTASGGNSIAVLTGTGMLNAQQVFNQANPDGATYLKLDAAMKTQPIVGAGPKVFGVDTGAATQHECALTDVQNAPIAVGALGAGKVNTADATEKLVVWTKTGQLLLYEPTVWSGTMASCTGSQATAGVDTMFTPGAGAQIFTVRDMMGKDTTFVVVAGRKAGTGGGPNDPDGHIAMYDLSQSPPAMVGAAIDKAGLHGMAVASFDGGHTQFFVAGYPTEPVDGVTAGQVLVYPLDTTNGINPTPATTLNDAQPENGQVFGRAVTAMPFNGGTALVVAADNEVYTYVRLSPLYEDLRQ